MKDNEFEIIELWLKLPSEINYKKLNKKIERKSKRMIEKLLKNGKIKWKIPYDR